MNDDNEQVTKVASGCVLAAWRLFVLAPMWLVLLFAILRACDMPTWTWALFWAYVPAYTLGVALAAFVQTVLDR